MSEKINEFAVEFLPWPLDHIGWSWKTNSGWTCLEDLQVQFRAGCFQEVLQKKEVNAVDQLPVVWLALEETLLPLIFLEGSSPTWGNWILDLTASAQVCAGNRISQFRLFKEGEEK